MNAWLPRERTQWVALSIGVFCLLACLLLSNASTQQALLSYLFAFLFFTGLSAGSLALAMVSPLTGGAWGDAIRTPLLAAARVLPLQALLTLPILIGMRALYPWTHADALAHDPLLRQQSGYLNPDFFVIRTLMYFAIWLALLWSFVNRLHEPGRLPRIAAPGLILFALSSLLAATDWSMSLLPHWHSSSYGMMVAVGWMLAAAALATLTAMCRTDSNTAQPPQRRHDLGNLLLMFVLGWSYLAFMQYLTVWIADLPAETAWYIPRTLTSWRWLAGFLIACHFAVPFALLLSRRAKRNRLWLGCIATLLLFANLADALWLVVPNFRAAGFALRWTDLAAPLGIGGLWLCVYIGQLHALRMSSATGARRMEAEHG